MGSQDQIRLMLIMAGQTRFGFPAKSKVSYVLSVSISLFLCGFFVWHFAAVFLYQLLKYSVICIAPLYVLLSKYFFDINFFLSYTMTNGIQSLALPGILTAGLTQCCLQPSFKAQQRMLNLRVKLPCKKHALPSLNTH